MSGPQYLELSEIVGLHAQLIERYGGSPGFRGEAGRGLVESALNRPMSKAYYEQADLVTQAAALYYGLAKNHGFIDGNKRIAVAATDVFLQVNGWELQCDNARLTGFTQRCSEPEWTEAAVVAFVREHAVRIGPS